MSYEFHAWLVYIPHASCAWKISLGCDRILCLLDVPGDRKSVGHAVKKIRVSHADFFPLCVPLGSQKLRERF